MSTPEEYKQHFATLPDARLVEVVQDPHDRDPAAVAAAHEELQRRGLATEQLSALQQRVAERKSSEEAWQRRVADTTRSLKQCASGFFIDNGSTPQDRRWRLWLVLALLIPFLLGLPLMTEYALIMGLDAFTDPTSYLLLVALLAPPVAMLLLWRKKRAGWFIATGFAAMSLVGAVLLFQQAFSRSMSYDDRTRYMADEPDVIYFEGDGTEGPIGFEPGPALEALDTSLDRPDYSEHILPLLWSIGLVAFFLVPRSRDIYAVTLKDAAVAVAVGIVAYPLWWLLVR